MDNKMITKIEKGKIILFQYPSENEPHESVVPMDLLAVKDDRFKGGQRLLTPRELIEIIGLASDTLDYYNLCGVRQIDIVKLVNSLFDK